MVQVHLCVCSYKGSRHKPTKPCLTEDLHIRSNIHTYLHNTTHYVCKNVSCLTCMCIVLQLVAEHVLGIVSCGCEAGYLCYVNTACIMYPQQLLIKKHRSHSSAYQVVHTCCNMECSSVCLSRSRAVSLSASLPSSSVVTALRIGTNRATHQRLPHILRPGSVHAVSTTLL